jgi:hypothetical protein
LALDAVGIKALEEVGVVRVNDVDNVVADVPLALELLGIVL